jgi:uncharacterized protein (TIGR00251 family)
LPGDIVLRRKNLAELALRERAGAVVLEVRVAPRAARAAIVGVHAGALKVSLTAAPVDGAANAALIELLAEALELPKRVIHIEHGETSKQKRLRIEGITPAALRERLFSASAAPR